MAKKFKAVAAAPAPEPTVPTELMQPATQIVVAGELRASNPIASLASAFAGSPVLIAMHVEQILTSLRASMRAHRDAAAAAHKEATACDDKIVALFDAYKKTGPGKEASDTITARLKTWIRGLHGDIKDSLIVVESRCDLLETSIDVTVSATYSAKAEGNTASGSLRTSLTVPAEIITLRATSKAARATQNTEISIADKIQNTINKPDELRRSAEADLGRQALMSGGEVGKAAHESLTAAAIDKAADIEAKLASRS